MMSRRATAGLISAALVGAATVGVPTPAGPTPTASAESTTLVISEFRLRGPNGASDEFIEIQNISGAAIVVDGGGTGFGIAASDGITRCTIPDGTVIPRFGHFLCVNSVGYGTASYPAGNGTTATGDATFTTNIADNAGIALFETTWVGPTTRWPDGSTPSVPPRRPTRCTRRARASPP